MYFNVGGILRDFRGVIAVLIERVYLVLFGWSGKSG